MANRSVPCAAAVTGILTNEAQARAVLTAACASVGLDPSDARLVRLGSNAVFRLTDPIVARIARSDTESAHARRTVAVARWLESEDYPAVRALPFDQPLTVNRYAVTFWQAVSPIGDEWTSVPEIAELLVRLHKLVAPNGLDLPEVAPFATAEGRIASSAWLTAGSRNILTDKLAELRERYARLEWVLTSGVIHGDASIGNALRDWNGRPVMIDLDNFAIGHREWDLILTAVYYDSFGWHTAEEYEGFTRAYGYDIMKWDGYPTLRELSEFMMITWVITKASENPRVADEASKRIETLRTGASRKDWAPLLRIPISGSGCDPPKPRTRGGIIELHYRCGAVGAAEVPAELAEVTDASG